MKKAIILAVLLLASSMGASAISANDAVGFATREGHYMLSGEDNQVPVSPITYDTKKYWLMPVVSGNEIITYIPIKHEKAELSTHRPTNRELFRTADTLRELNIEKSKLSESQSAEWIFSTSYVLIFNEMSRGISNETYEMNIISSTMDDADMDRQILKINSLIASMSQKTNDISQRINSAALSESDFFSSPTPEKVDSLKTGFDNVFSTILELNELALDYRDEVDSLKQMISVSDQSIEAKDYLIKLASPPAVFNNIGKYTTTSLALSSDVDAIYSNVSSRVDSLLNEYDSRVKRNEAFIALYGENEKLNKATGGEIIQVDKGVETILAKDNRPYWKNQELIKTLESKWGQTQREFNSGNYDSSVILAGKVADDVVAIYKQGFVETVPAPLISQELLIQIIIGLAVLLVLLVLYSKRDRILSFGKGTEKEVELDAWKQ